ncbi:universal stress protein [Bacteriovoracaceae bacterium]|nr:universal stress protein [Bacteriovoracaceae bacterium]
MVRILVPTDFSHDSQKAIDFAVNFFKDKSPSKIHLLNTYMVQKSDGNNIIDMNDRIKEMAMKGLERAKDYSEQLTKTETIDVETHLKIGSLKNVIYQMIKEQGIDLVVMGRDAGKHINEVSKHLKDKSAECPIVIVSA